MAGNDILPIPAYLMTDMCPEYLFVTAASVLANHPTFVVYAVTDSACQKIPYILADNTDVAREDVAWCKEFNLYDTLLARELKCLTLGSDVQNHRFIKPLRELPIRATLAPLHCLFFLQPGFAYANLLDPDNPRLTCRALLTPNETPGFRTPTEAEVGACAVAQQRLLQNCGQEYDGALVFEALLAMQHYLAGTGQSLHWSEFLTEYEVLTGLLISVSDVADFIVTYGEYLAYLEAWNFE
ncbi:hypothetical protein BAUCODRAFT_133965 [Baudoinia panamericana UAMH 10762]|uniref:Uncharacterized protein n=1 Tax=Baudoinia panamericana (strain UAMH 10762) TaxID=717646 RepID=M2MNT2_BAUPA|nr:uncharacterized protein BAUCODRAFT_133965 [Baudoinia panamericana UAMH 10762]EMC93113.1 hypothetical protein BAUCODRAFT_133965 [Baudoinia panamericana UAMH 10762]